MFERTVSLTLAVLLPLIAACSSLETRDYAPGDLPVPSAERRIVAVSQASGERVAFDREAGGRDAQRPFVADEQVVGPVRGQPVRVDLTEGSTVSIEEKRIQVGRTVLLVLGVSVVTFYGIALASFSVGGL